MPEDLPCQSTWQNAIEILHSEFDSDAVLAASNVIRFVPRPLGASRRPLTPHSTDTDRFFSTLAAAMARKSVTAYKESF
jgi:hypothetical protein